MYIDINTSIYDMASQCFCCWAYELKRRCVNSGSIFFEDIQQRVQYLFSAALWKKKPGGLEFHLSSWRNKTVESLTFVYRVLVPYQLKISQDYIYCSSPVITILHPYFCPVVESYKCNGEIAERSCWKLWPLKKKKHCPPFLVNTQLTCRLAVHTQFICMFWNSRPK